MSDETSVASQADAPKADSEALDCASCGYNLTGVAIGRSCPECGVGVNESIRLGRSMTQRQAIAVVLRLLALVFAFMYIEVFDFLVWSLIALSGVSSAITWDPDWGWYLLVNMFSLGLRIALAAGLWWMAPRIAAWLVKRDGALLGASRINARGLLSMGLVLVGVYAVIDGGASLASVLVTYWVESQNWIDLFAHDGFSSTGLMSSLTWLICGLVLIKSAPLRFWLGKKLPRS